MGGGVVDPGPEARVKLAASVMWDENNLTFSVGAPLHAQLMQGTQETLGQKYDVCLQSMRLWKWVELM